MIADDNLNEIYEDLKVISFDNLLNLESEEIIKRLLDSKKLNSEISKEMVNKNKWIRLRKTNGETSLTLKHVYEKCDSKIQKIKEYEVKIEDAEEMKSILEEIGIVNRNY